MKHELPRLPYPKNALEPAMSAETLEFHYGRHHKNYVDKLNQLIQGTEFENRSLEEIVMRSQGSIFNNGAQAWNHSFFWNCLTPEKGVKPTGSFLSQIERDFGSTDRLLEELKKSAVGVFGSGWAWLVFDPATGKLGIEATANAENPMRWGRNPLLTCDVWEHAYYIDYRNERARFLDAVRGIVNWNFAQNNFELIRKQAAA